MRRHGLLVLAALVAALVAAVPAGAAVGSLTPSDAAFPQRSFVLTLPPGVAPSASDIQVSENGKPVDDLKVSAADQRFAVLLVIDASASMRGEPINGAMAAARAFAAQRPAAQALGVVTFNDKATVLLRPTTDKDKIAAALRDNPPLAPRTHIYDAVDTALQQVGGRYEASAIVVLSDGHDFGSKTTSREIGAGARKAHAHLYTVGLQSDVFEPSTLKDVATVGGGEYLGAASAGALADVYRRLGVQLASAYTIRYRSTLPLGTRVRVEAGTDTAQATRTYQAPHLRVPGALAALPADKDTSFLGSSAGALIVALIVLVLVMIAMLALLGSRRRRVELVDRINDYAVTGGPRPSEQRGPRHALAPGSFMARLAKDLDIGRIDLTPGAFVARVSAVAFIVAILGALIMGSVLIAPVLILLVALGARAYVKRHVHKQRAEFADQLADTVQAIASSMRTGNSFAGAMAQVASDAPEPTASELRRVVADERLGVPLEEALEVVVERMDNRDLGQVGLVSVLQRETGGNGAEALERVVQNIRSRDDVRRLVRSLTGQGRLAQRVLTALPVVTLIVLSLINSEQMKPLYDTAGGRLALVVALCMVTAGGMWIRRIVDIRI